MSSRASQLVGLWDTLSSEAKKVVWISPPVPSRLSFCLARYETVLKSPFVHPDSIVLQCCYKVMMKVLLWGWMESQSWHWLCTAYLSLCKGLLPLLAWVVLFYYLPFDCKYIRLDCYIRLVCCMLLKLARQKPLSKPQWLSHFQLCAGLLHEPTMYNVHTSPQCNTINNACL